jgi:hypothetical protein
MTTKQYRNNYKDMHPTVARHIGREIVLATLNDASAQEVNDRFKAASIVNPDESAVIFTEAHLNQMKSGIRSILTLVQDTAPYRFGEALDLVVNMHTGGSYGPWYRKWYIPHALKTGAPLWVSSSAAHKITAEIKTAQLYNSM